MPHSNIVEWVAGGTLPQRRRKVSTLGGESMAKISGTVTVETDETSDSSCCSTCSSCSSSCSVASVNFFSKKVHFKQPKGILKNAKDVEKEEHKCCSACTPKSHCNERHNIGKNGKVYGSSKKCAAPRNATNSSKARTSNKNNKTAPTDGRNTANSNSSKAKTSNKNDTNSSKFSTSLSTHTNRVLQTPEERQTAQHLGFFINRNMSRLILPSRAEVIIREDVLENPSDPRPNAFFDARTGILRVYHGPVYGNPSGSLVPLQAQHVPIGTPAAPTSARGNPWAGMMNGMNGMLPFGMHQRGGGGNFGQQCNAGTSQSNNSGNNGSNPNNQNNSSSSKRQARDTNAKGSSDGTGSRRMPGSFHNDDDQKNGNSGWETSNQSSDNKNSNDDTWGTENDNNASSGNDAGNSNDLPADVWAGDTDNNASSGNDDEWGVGNDSSNNNNNSSNDNEWGGNSYNNNSNNNSSGWQSSNSNNNNNKSSPNNNYSNPTGTVMSAGSWGADNGQGPTAGGNGNNWSKPTKQESWGDASAAQSTKPTDETSGW